MVPRQSHFLYPAAIYASRKPTLVTTILGSCVSVCLWDSKLGYGGINHYMLPLWNGQGLPSPKYGNIAIERLIDRMIFLGSDPADLGAKIFGGGEILITKSDQFYVGNRNIQIALEMIKDAGIPVLGRSLGGRSGRKIIFDTVTGMVRQNLIIKNNCKI